MNDIFINDTYDRIAKILKNDQQYSYKVVSEKIVSSVSKLNNIDRYYEKYPPLLDVIELGASLGYEGSGYQAEIIKQIQYKMSELRMLLPDIR